MSEYRIPFAEAIQEELLLAPRMRQLSIAQGTALKSFYGVPLSEDIVDPQTGLHELDYWTFFQGGGLQDELGYPLGKPGVQIPYTVGQEFREGWMVVGRRGSKTDTFAASIAAYEAALGGHEQYVRAAQPAIVFLISQDLRAARYALNFVRGVLESSPLLARSIKQVTSDRIDLKNNITIASIPATLKASRGFANPVAILDEVGVWYQESESANPDYEIYRAVRPGQLQFPNRKIVGISTPWNKAGLLYRFYEAGTNGNRLAREDPKRSEFRDVLVLHGSTALMGNPFVVREELEADRARDVKAFEREYLAIFQDSISGFLPATMVEASIDRGVIERPRQEGFTYVAAMDPAFKRDAFGFTVTHRDADGNIIQDCVRRFVAPPGESLNPRAILQAIAPLCESYGISILHTDQYQMESLSELARELNLIVMGMPFTAKSKATMFINLQQMFAQGKIRVLDDSETIKELKSLERTLTSDTIKIAAPSGMNDDMACVLCLSANQAQWFAPREPRPRNENYNLEPLTPYDRVQKQLQGKRAGYSSWD